MRITDLTDKFTKRTVYVIGTGPSARLFPKTFFDYKNAISVGLNNAWKQFRCNYSLTVHPEHVVDYDNSPNKIKYSTGGTTWVTKPKPPLDDLKPNDPTRYVFTSTENPDVIGDGTTNELFVGRGIQTAGIDLALRMGASVIVLVGVDMGTLGGQHHASPQHVRFNGLLPKDVYREYYEWTSFVRDIAFRRKVPVLSMSALLGEAWRTEEFSHLMKLNNFEPFPDPPDTSHYVRKKTDSPPKI